jgi:predicted nucleic acid-binding protein
MRLSRRGYLGLGRRPFDTVPASSFAKNARSDYTTGLTLKRATTSKNAWSESVYLDTDPVLALLKTDDWLASVIDLETIDSPKTSVATAIEVQYVMEDTWSRDQLSNSHVEIATEGIELVPLTVDVMDAAGELRREYDSLNVFDAVHLGTAYTLNEPIVSTDTLYPDIAEVEHIDPRDLE